MVRTFVILSTCVGCICVAEEYYYNPYNVSRSTMSGIAAYRSALTLDWLAAEDLRQRELAAAFETEAAPPSRILTTECIAYARPSSGKIARLMLELLRNLEGDDAKLLPELIQVLIRSKMLVETSILDAEPNLDALVKTPGVMMGEPHVTFPRILAMIWLIVTDPSTTKQYGWCPINKVNKYLSVNKSPVIAKHMRALEPIIARARFIMEEFIQNITPLNMYQKNLAKHTETPRLALRRDDNAVRRPIRFYSSKFLPVENAIPTTTSEEPIDPVPRVIDGSTIVVTNSSNSFKVYEMLFFIVVYILQ